MTMDTLRTILGAALTTFLICMLLVLSASALLAVLSAFKLIRIPPLVSWSGSEMPRSMWPEWAIGWVRHAFTWSVSRKYRRWWREQRDWSRLLGHGPIEGPTDAELADEAADMGPKCAVCKLRPSELPRFCPEDDCPYL